ncbi:Uncharacterized protein OBRU01_06934, partial [Operophtera brumata]
MRIDFETFNLAPPTTVIYIRVNASTNSRSIRINFKIADRNTQPNLPQATWKIKVTQLECFNTLG